LVDAGVRVLVVSGVTDELEIAATLEAGATGFVSKTRAVDELVDAVVRSAEGEHVVPAAERQRLLLQLRQWRCHKAAEQAPLECLTPREREVLRQLADGHAVNEIAETSFVSVATVRSQVRAILLKLEVGSQLEAVAVAHRHGWFESSPYRNSA
jgi:DNA-binding NarL/FixJ family response regulator